MNEIKLHALKKCLEERYQEENMFVFNDYSIMHSFLNTSAEHKKEEQLSEKELKRTSAFLPPFSVSSFSPLRFSRCTLSSFFLPLSFLLHVDACKRFVPFYSLQNNDKA